MEEVAYGLIPPGMSRSRGMSTPSEENDLLGLWSELQDQARLLVEQGDYVSARKVFAEADKVHNRMLKARNPR